jgi:glucose/arabinose dehydrogenase
MRSAGLALVVLTLASSSLTAATEADIECRWAVGPMAIDGQADDADWEHAQTIDNFTLPWLQKNAPPAKTATRAKLLWDREYLYFLAEMEDHDLFADVMEDDGQTWHNDVFELFFRPAEDKPGYYEFQVNAAGTRMDMFLPKRGVGYDQQKSDGTFLWKTAVVRRGTLDNRRDRDEGWTVEGQIPWTDLMRTGGRPAVGEVWRFALCRYDYTLGQEPELSTCAPLTERSFHKVEDYARLRFLGMESNPRQPLGIRERVPLTTSTVVGSPDPPPPYRPVRAFAKLKLNWPMAIDPIPGTDELLLIVQQWSSGPGSIVRIPDSADVEAGATVLEIPRGGVAYGLCFHPRFAENGYLYVGWNGRLTADDKEPKKTIVTRYTLDRSMRTIDPESALHVISWESDGHNGGDLEFGTDGMLYVTSGDGTSDSDTNMRGQDLTQLTAKVLRIDVDRPAEGQAYSVPADNPFVDQEGIVPETWAYGLRNPWRLTVDPRTGHVWVGNNGQDLWEQVYFVRKGDNYGWSVYEGSHIFYANRQLGPHPHMPPAAEHHHSEARSLTGGVVYYGQKLPELHGAYIYGDHSTGRIWGIKHDGDKVIWHKLLADTPFNISGFGVDSAGELLVADHRGGGEGAFYYLEPTPEVDHPGKFPRKLSESGLFADVARHVPTAGAVPYSVNSPLWSDGTHKERFIAIPHKPGEDMRIGFTTNRGWDFPDQSVLVKSFALETIPGDASSRRWIETRFLTKQQGEWAGYSYIWNEEQTDAELVPAEGLDREYTVLVPRSREHPDGQMRQTWRYPSRTECMVCHSRAANFVLGLTTLQMNKDHNYGGVVDNQLRTLEHLGMLRADYRTDALNFLKEDLRQAGHSQQEVNRLAGERSVKPDQRQVAVTSLLAVPPLRYAALPDPYDEAQPLEPRARAYLHANCSICHVEAGGGNAQMDLEFTVSPQRMKVIDVPPLHHKFGLEDPRSLRREIPPGRCSCTACRSVVKEPGRCRSSERIGSTSGGKVLERWIQSLKPDESHGAK